MRPWPNPPPDPSLVRSWQRASCARSRCFRARQQRPPSPASRRRGEPSSTRPRSAARSCASRTRSSSAPTRTIRSTSSRFRTAGCRWRVRLAENLKSGRRPRRAARHPRHHAVPRRSHERPASVRSCGAHGDAVLGRRPARDPDRGRRQHRAHDPRGHGRTDGLRAAGGRAGRRARRPRPSRAADQDRLRRQEHPDAAPTRRSCCAASGDGEGHRRARGRAAGSWSSSEAGCGARSRGRARDDRKKSARDRGSRARGDRDDPRDRRADEGDRRARGQEGPDAARPDDRQHVLRAVDAHARELRDRGQAPVGGRRQLLAVTLERDEGREHPRHRTDPRRDGSRTP